MDPGVSALAPCPRNPERFWKRAPSRRGSRGELDAVVGTGERQSAPNRGLTSREECARVGHAARGLAPRLASDARRALDAGAIPGAAVLGQLKRRSTNGSRLGAGALQS